MGVKIEYKTEKIKDKKEEKKCRRNKEEYQEE